MNTYNNKPFFPKCLRIILNVRQGSPEMVPFSGHEAITSQFLCQPDTGYSKKKKMRNGFHKIDPQAWMWGNILIS